MKNLELFKFDVRFQFRHGFYAAYALVSIVYISLLLLAPTSYIIVNYLALKLLNIQPMDLHLHGTFQP